MTHSNNGEIIKLKLPFKVSSPSLMLSQPYIQPQPRGLWCTAPWVCEKMKMFCLLGCRVWGDGGRGLRGGKPTGDFGSEADVRLTRG